MDSLHLVFISMSYLPLAISYSDFFQIAVKKKNLYTQKIFLKIGRQHKKYVSKKNF